MADVPVLVPVDGASSGGEPADADEGTPVAPLDGVPEPGGGVAEGSGTGPAAAAELSEITRGGATPASPPPVDPYEYTRRLFEGLETGGAEPVAGTASPRPRR